MLASLIAVAFLGVFAYRTIFNNQPTRAAVVTKSNAPTKVEPKATPQTVNPSNKPIQDRLGAPEPTQIMRREEAPADVSRQNQNPQLPAATKNNPAFTPPPAQQPVQQQQVPQQQNPVVEQQPKRVKTIPLRSDGIPQSAAPQQQQQNSGPMQLQATPQVQDQPETQSIPQNRSNTNSRVPPPAPQRTNVASLGTPAPATGTGNYIVQVASHKTPEEAQTAWATLRQQYSTIFGARNADIRKVDLGDRGTFYRAMVGPMNREQANALCQNLKTQGAGCIVQTRN